MKLNKSKLLNYTKNQLNELGYHLLIDNISPADVLYGKLLENGFFLTLGLTISRYYDAKFAASFYLSKTTIWAAVWGDIPEESYKRISNFLTREERHALLSEEDTKDGIVDGWWNDTKTEVSNFIETVKITESRFLAQKSLFNSIESSLVIKKMHELSLRVIEDLDSPDGSFDYKMIQKIKVTHIPLNWFMTAERVLYREKEMVNINTVKRLAADAWRRKNILTLTNFPL